MPTTAVSAGPKDGGNSFTHRLKNMFNRKKALKPPTIPGTRSSSPGPYAAPAAETGAQLHPPQSHRSQPPAQHDRASSHSVQIGSAQSIPSPHGARGAAVADTDADLEYALMLAAEEEERQSNGRTRTLIRHVSTRHRSHSNAPPVPLTEGPSEMIPFRFEESFEGALCPLCGQDFDVNDYLYLLSGCLDRFHISCLEIHFEDHDYVCPTCDKEVDVVGFRSLLYSTLAQVEGTTPPPVPPRPRPASPPLPSIPTQSSQLSAPSTSTEAYPVSPGQRGRRLIQEEEDDDFDLPGESVELPDPNMPADMLPIRFRPPSGVGAKPEECIICRDTFVQNEELLIVSTCLHKFHQQCITG
ncbi:hypothetical protein HDU96_006502 [Phlyctochytrium bullatum]|nr:hypothetical protein HDU96_006502 [Phlyctochytrium bullatum]